MPLPKLQPDIKRPRLQKIGINIDDLDDYCLSKVLGYALILSSQREDLSLASDVPTKPCIRDNSSTEKNLSLVSKRWYLLTQALVALHGVHRVELGNTDKQPKATTKVTALAAPKAIQTGRNIPMNGSRLQPPTIAVGTKLRPPGVLTTRNQLASAGAGFGSLQRSCTGYNFHTKPPMLQKQQATFGGKHSCCNYDISLFRSLMPKLRKYNHLIVGGALKCDQFRKLLIALDATRVERLELKLNIQKDETSPNLFALMPERLDYIKELSFCWLADSPSEAACNFSNALNWTIFQRAFCLRRLEIYLQETITSEQPNVNEHQQNDTCQASLALEPSGFIDYQQRKSIDRICNEYLKRTPKASHTCHPNLRRLVFYRTTSGATGTDASRSLQNLQYSQLIKDVLNQATHLDYLETNDRQVIEHSLELSKRVCTRVAIRHLKFANPITEMTLLQDLLDLRTESLSLVFESLDQVGDIFNLVEQHIYSCNHLVPLAPTRCQLRLLMRDQKFTDAEDKIKRLSQLCRLAELTIQVAAHMRVSIDCCHMMWSVGRSLNQYGQSARCLFRIHLQTSVNVNSKAFTEISVPFGGLQDHKINPSREDPNRHREILRALKRDCYHSFVKSVRDYV